MKKIKIKRIFCIMLSICMVTGILPAIAFAEEESVVNVTAIGNDTIKVVESEDPSGDNETDILTIHTDDAQVIDRDYSQEITIKVENPSDAPVQYYLTCDNKNEDLYMNFVQSGSKDAPLTIQPGEAQDVILSVFAQNAVKTDYRVGVTAHIMDTNDVVSLEVAFKCKGIDGMLEMTKGTTSETTLAMDYTVKNTGKEKITDVTLLLSGDVSEYAYISPSIENMEIDPNDSITVKIIPDLTKMKTNNKEKIEGTLVALGGASVETAISIDTSGKEITSTTMGNLALIQDGNPFADMEFYEDENLSFSTNINGKEQNFSDITAKYWEEGNPEKNGIDTEDELKEVVETLFDEDGMIDFTIRDKVSYDGDKTMDVSVTVKTELESEHQGRLAKTSDVSDDIGDSKSYIDDNGAFVTETKVYMTLDEYYEYREKIKGVSDTLNIPTKWDNYFAKPESTNGKVVVNVIDKLQGSALSFPKEFINDTTKYVDYSRVSIDDLATKYSDYSKFASGTFSKGVSVAANAGKYLDTAINIYDTAAILSSPNENITAGQRAGYTTLQVARNINRYWGGKLLGSKLGVSIGTAIGDGPGAVIGFFAGNVVSGLIGFGLDQWIKSMEEEFKLEEGSAIYNDIYGHQCTNAGKVTSDFYLPDYTDNRKPNIYETGRMYDENEDEDYYVDKSSVGYDYYINDNKVADSKNNGLTQVTIADLSDGREYLKPGKNTVIRDYDTNPGHYFVTADTEMTLVYPTDTPISYIGNPEGSAEVRLLPDFAVYRENITTQNTPIKGEANKIELYVYNRGSHSGWVDVSVSSTESIGKIENLYMDAFSEKKLEFDWTPSANGEVRLNVELTNKGLGMTERKNNNNRASKSIFVRERQIPGIAEIYPKELYLDEDKAAYITANLVNTQDLDKVNISIDGIGSESPSLTWKDNKNVQVSASTNNLAVGTHIVKVTATYFSGAESTATIEKEQELYVKGYTTIPFQTDETIINPEFSILSLDSGRITSANISINEGNYIFSNNKYTTGHEGSSYLITKSDSGVILTRLDELKDKTISLQGAKKVTLEKESEITESQIYMNAVEINGVRYSLSLGGFDGFDILLAGMDMASLNISFNIDMIRSFTNIEVDPSQDQTIKLSDHYALYQIICGENASSFRNFIGIINGTQRIWPDSSSYDPTTGIQSILFGKESKKNIDEATEFNLFLQNSNSLYCLDLNNYTMPIQIDENMNHKLQLICQGSENLEIIKIELSSDIQAFMFEGNTINIPSGSYQLSVNYIIDGKRNSYRAMIDVAGDDITIELPNTVDIPDEYGSLSLTWPETLGNSAEIYGSVEKDGSINYMQESNIKNGETLSWPNGKTALRIRISGYSENGYSQTSSEISREFYLDENEDKNIDVGMEFYGKANVSDPNEMMTAGKHCTILLSDLKDQNENILSNFYLYGYQTALYGEMILKDTSDPQKIYKQAFTTNSIPYINLSLPSELPVGTYDYEISISTKEQQSSGIFYNITTEIEGNGTITPRSPQVLEGTDQIFTIVPDSGNYIKDVIVDGIFIGNVTSYTFKNVVEDHSIKVIFDKSNSSVINPPVNPGGNVTTQTPTPSTRPTEIPTPSGNETPTETPIPSLTPVPTGTVTPTKTPDTQQKTAQMLKSKYGSNGKRLKMKVGSRLTQVITGAKTTVTFRSSNTKVAKVGKTSGVIRSVGVGKAVIEAKAAESSQYKTAEKRLTICVVPKTAKISFIKSNKKGKVTIKSSKATKGNDGYQIQYKHNGRTKKVKVKSSKALTKTLGNLKSGKNFKARIRVYKKVDGTTYYGNYSGWKTVKKVR